MALNLPFPKLIESHFMSLDYFTDERLFDHSGIRIAFTTRMGGFSKPPYDSLNLAMHVKDNPDLVKKNRDYILNALDANHSTLLVPNQVHKDTVVIVSEKSDFVLLQQELNNGCDSIIIDVANVTALLNFADCVPIIIVAPDLSFSVVHAGWRGVMNDILEKTLNIMVTNAHLHSRNRETEFIKGINVYIGPYIHEECFKVSKKLYDQFINKFNTCCSTKEMHINLGQCLLSQMKNFGIDTQRVTDLNYCTVCNNDRFFSYRKSKGTTGRHSALALKVKD